MLIGGRKMIEGIAQILLAIGTLLFEITVWAAVGLYVAIRAIVSPVHREKIRHEWRSGWKGKACLVFSGVFWIALVAAAVWIWFPARSSLA